jgi:hypothetical protein
MKEGEMKRNIEAFAATIVTCFNSFCAVAASVAVSDADKITVSSGDTIVTEPVLDGLQKTLFPVKVEGSAQFGLNRNSCGWWLWCLNNRGVKKFADSPQEIDHSFDSALSIDVSRLGAVSCRELVSGRGAELKSGSLSWNLPAGELAVFKLVKSDE